MVNSIKISFLLITFLCISKFLSSQEFEYNCDSLKKNTYFNSIDPSNPINGIEKGAVIFETLNDTLNGEFKVYDYNETLRFEAYVFNGKKEGAAFSYNRKGELEEIRSYSDNKVVTRIFKDRGGRIYKIENYNLEEKKNGKETKFYRSGKPRAVLLWDKGVLREEAHFYRNGHLDILFLYDCEERLIEIKDYRRNGKLKK